MNCDTYTEQNTDVKFPCPQDNKLTSIPNCQCCSNHMRCDIYCTMLDEVNDMK